MTKELGFTPLAVKRGAAMVRKFRRIWLAAFKELSPTGGRFKKFHYLLHFFKLVTEYGALVNMGKGIMLIGHDA